MSAISSINKAEVSFNFESAEETAKRVLDRDKEEYAKSRKEKKSATFLSITKKEDSDWDQQFSLYCKIETYIRENEDAIPSWQVAGPLNYGMTIDEMKSAIQQKFQKMAESGKLITEKNLNENHERSAYFPSTGKGSNNLTRIWGAEFIKSNLSSDTSLDVAEHYLIVEEGTSELEVQVWLNDYPTLCSMNGGYILSKKIEGECAAHSYWMSSTLVQMKYRDFSDPGNIIRDTNGVGWVVDTEWKSFDFPELEFSDFHIKEYAKKRFQVLSCENDPSLYHLKFKIPLSDIGLK